LPSDWVKPVQFHGISFAVRAFFCEHSGVSDVARMVGGASSSDSVEADLDDPASPRSPDLTGL
jgi:hypothetical protein